MTRKIQSIRGMNDLLPGQIEVWHAVERAIRSVAVEYGYREIRLPLLEKTALFKRSIGEVTDIVEKEMYTFLDQRGNSLSLRPEATASCVRAGIQHGLFHNAQVRLWYMGPMFRYERPQKGRYRQFHQFGIEAFGWVGPDIDAEVIALGAKLWKMLGIDQGVTLQVNSLGDAETRARYRENLVSYFKQYQSDLDRDSRRRLTMNPLRILDSKNPAMQDMIQNAPTMIEFLDDESKKHFDSFCEYLSLLNISFEIDHRLVRGLDYYTNTVFEWKSEFLGAQNAFCAGGRYDGLAEVLGGKSVPGAGFALGVERLVELVKIGKMEPEGHPTQVYVCVLGDTGAKLGFKVAESLRNLGICATLNCGGGKLASQLRKAHKLDAAVSIIIGDLEASANTAVVKDMNAKQSQTIVAIDEIEAAVTNLLNPK